MKVLIGSAWPYANGSLHIGHLAGLLPADILARYHRAKGDDVYFVSGSDCFGTPVAIRARQEGRTPGEISDFYHEEFCECFKKLGFSYDLYGKTSSREHQEFVKEFHRKIYESPYIYEKSVPQAFCKQCNRFLADRFVVGICPACGKKARGDQCDACGIVLEPEQLIDPICTICGSTPVFKESKHLFMVISKMEKFLKELVDTHPNWRKNAVAFTNRYINEGLRDRAITRDLDWGVDVPKDGYDGKKIYIWAENVLGYLSMSREVCRQRGTEFSELWGKEAKHYYVHGKDNIPFHTIILPALLFCYRKDDTQLGDGTQLEDGIQLEDSTQLEDGTQLKDGIDSPDDIQPEEWHLPDEIVSSEYMTLEGRKISTSSNWAVWLKDIVDQYDPDSLRYFFTTNGPERRDSDFSWQEYLHCHNSELLGAYGNFVNRNLAFVEKYFDNIVPEGSLEKEIQQRLEEIYQSVGRKIEKASLRDALDEIFELVRFGNRYFDANKPWNTRKDDIATCKQTIFNCLQLIANLSVLLSPFLPFSSEKVQGWLGLDTHWGTQYVESGYLLPKPEILFERLEKGIIEKEVAALEKL